jgi:hypothetical protein
MSPEPKARLVLLSVNLPAALAERLTAFCSASGLNRTAATRLALSALLANVPKSDQSSK